MNNYDIKNKANEILANSTNLLKTLIFIGVVNTIINAVGDVFTGTIGMIISLVILIIMVPFEHGYIVSTLKAVCNRDHEIDMKQDGLVGLYRFKELFSTYFVYSFLLIVINIMICLVFLVIGLFIMSPAEIEALKQFITICIEYSTGNTAILSQVTTAMTSAIGSMLTVLFMMVVVLCIVSIVYSLTFALTPYILERYEIKGFTALKESQRLMKGNKWILFKLELSFFGWALLAGFIIMALDSVVVKIISVPFIYTLIVNILSVFVTVYLYGMKLKVCEAIFYEELDYEDKQIIDVEDINVE